MKNFLFRIGIISIASIANLYGQTDNEKTIGNGIYILPTQLVFPEVLLTYEHFVKDNLSYSLSLGYKIPVGRGDKIEPFGSGLFAVYEHQYMFNEYSNGVYLSFAPSIYKNENRKYFISPELFYRYYWFHDKKLSFDNGVTDRYNSIRSEQNHVFGIKILAGYNSMVSLSETSVLNFKLYAGLSTRIKVYNYENVDNILPDGNIIPFETEKGVYFWPVGIQLGFNPTCSKFAKI